MFAIRSHLAFAAKRNVRKRQRTGRIDIVLDRKMVYILLVAPLLKSKAASNFLFNLIGPGAAVADAAATTSGADWRTALP